MNRFIYKIALIGSIVLTLNCSVYGQNPTPNAGFEEWTFVNFFGQFYIPNSWDNLDSATAIIGILTCQQSTDAHSGEYAVKLVTYQVDIFGTDTANGVITTGNLITVPPYGISGGIPYTQRPDSIALWLKYTPASGDSTQIQFDLFTNSGDTIGTALIKVGKTVSSYTRYSAPVQYYSAVTPELSRWLISSSNGYKAVPGSVLYVDDLELLFTIGIDEIQDASGISIQQSGQHSLEILNPNHITGQLIFYNELGMLREIYALNNERMSVTLNPSSGILLCAVFDEKGNVIYRKKMVLQP